MKQGGGLGGMWQQCALVLLQAAAVGEGWHGTWSRYVLLFFLCLFLLLGAAGAGTSSFGVCRDSG